MTRNIALLCLDTVRKDYFEEYAQRLPEKADVNYTQCRAASCWSAPSHASIFTGRLPHEHGVHAYAPRFDSLEQSNTLHADLPHHQFIGASANTYAGTPYGFDSLFDDFVDVSRDHRYVSGLNVAAHLSDEPTDHGQYRTLLREIAAHPQRKESLLNAVAVRLDYLTREGRLSDKPALFDDGATSVRRAARHRLSELDEETPFFLFTNFMEAHEPHRDTLQYDSKSYTVPEGWDSRDLNTEDAANQTDDVKTSLEHYRELYGAAIDYLDRVVDPFVDHLLEITPRETTVIITADHGENLGFTADNGHLGHVTSLTEGLLHVPLLIINPPEDYETNEEEYISQLSLRRLIAHLARGNSPVVTADRIPAEVIGITPGNSSLEEADTEYWTRSIRCSYENQIKYIWDSRGVVQQVDLDPDRPCWQQQRRVSSQTRPNNVTHHFSTSIDDLPKERNGADDEMLDNDVRRRLRQLGYRE